MSFLNFSDGLFRSPLRESQSASNLARSPSSPFCTSPSQLQEVTLDQDGSFSNTMRSPTGPMRGRTVKEFEEQLTTLKKENFNLKLRIYFLEEKMGTNFTLDEDNIVKKNIELQVDVANLQKEVKEKHDLLCQAVKAMELEEEEHKQYARQKEEQFVRLQQEIDELKLQMQVNACKRDIDQANSSFERSEMLRFQIDALQKACESKEKTVSALNRELSSANERLLDFTDQIKGFEQKLERAHEQHECVVAKMQEQQKTMERLCTQLEGANQRYISAKSDLDEERKERERERKSFERNQASSTQRMDGLYNDNKKQKETIRELQSKLEAAACEAKKNQNLAVHQDRANASPPLTDHHFISVPDAAAPDGTAQKDAPHVPVGGGPGMGGVRSPAPATPDGRGLTAFERLLSIEGSETLRVEFGTVKAEVTALRQKIVKLKGEQLKACEIIKSMIDIRNKSNDEIAQLKRAKADLERELEGVVSKPTNENMTRLVCQEAEDDVDTPPCENTRVSDSHLDDMEIMDQYKLLTQELEVKVEVLVATLKEKDSQMQAIRAQYDDILSTLEEKENRIVDLEFELLSHQNSGKIDKSLLEKGDSGSEKHSSFYKHELDEKNEEIERLNVKLKKCTCYLQEIVNKELWEKNREIEKLHRKHENTSEVVKLKKELSGKDSQLKLLKEKISEMGLDIELSNNVDEVMSPKRNLEHIKILQEQLRNAKEEKQFLAARLKETETMQDAVERLKIENDNFKEELEKCERLRNETNEVCCILSSRLEELAIFLDSLLKQKSVLGFLGIAKNKRLREIISNSLDMSRSFSMSLMGNPEQSLAQLSNITAFLNGSVFQDLSIAEDEPETHLSIVPDNISLTYESNLWKKAGTRAGEPDNERVISALREQVFNLKNELRLRDTELNRLNSNKFTETEEEDDNKVKNTPMKEREAQSESEAWSEPDRAVSRARIGLNHSLPVMPKVTQESTEDDDFCSDNATPKKRSSVIDLTQEIWRLEKELAHTSEEAVENSRVYKQKFQQLNDELQEVRGKYCQAHSEKITVEKKLTELQKTVDDLSAYKTQCEKKMIGKDKEAQDKINLLEIERQNLLEQVHQYEVQLASSKNDLLQAQEHLQMVKNELMSQGASLKQQHEEIVVLKLKEAEETFATQVRAVEQKCEAEIKITQENLRLVKEEYVRDYVKRVDVQKKLNEVENLLGELSVLKTTVKSYEETIQSYKDKEREVKSVVQEYQEKLASLRTELDTTALQYSEAVLEKTKLREENQTLSREVDVISKKEQSLRAELTQIQINLTEVSQKYDQQVSTLHRQRNGLELRISELQSSNAELHNKLIKMQTSRPGRPPCGRLPRQYSDEEDIRMVRPPVHPHDEAERAVANSSPDLGIESDHGRFSSLETNTNNIPRPLLQTIELTESMNNLFEEHQSRSNAPGNEYCCQKFLQIEQENNELRQKLLRMKRALEETAAQLNLANQRKKQVEKTICKQIHKTSQVLRKAKANLDSGSESDVLRT